MAGETQLTPTVPAEAPLYRFAGLIHIGLALGPLEACLRSSAL